MAFEPPRAGEDRVKSRDGLAVLFDLDGVVLDSIWSIWMATREVLSQGGVPLGRLPDLQSFLSHFSMPGHYYYRGFGVTTSDEQLDRQFLEALPFYEAVVESYPEMPETIEKLRAQAGAATAIVSAGSLERVEQKLTKFGLRGLFDAVYAGAANKTASIKDCCRRFDRAPARTFFVGDIQSDMRDGRAAGIVPIGFAAGYPFMPAVLVAAGAAAWVHEPEDLLTTIPEVLNES